MQKTEARQPSLIIHTHTQNNSKWIKDLNLRPEILKLLKQNKNMGNKLLDITLGDDFLHVTSKTKAKISGTTSN